MIEFVPLSGYEARRQRVFNLIDEALVEQAIESHNDAWYQSEIERATAWLNLETDTNMWSRMEVWISAQDVAGRFFSGIDTPFAPEHEANRQKECVQKVRKWLRGVVAETRHSATKEHATGLGRYEGLLTITKELGVTRKSHTPHSLVDFIRETREQWQSSLDTYEDWEKDNHLLTLASQRDARLGELWERFSTPEPPSGGGYKSWKNPVGYEMSLAASASGPGVKFPDTIIRDLPALTEWAIHYHKGGIAALEEVLAKVEEMK